MDASVFSVFVFFLLVSKADGKLGGLKLCVVGNPDSKSTRTTKHCDLLGESKRTPVSCVYAADRLGCLLAVSRRNADFSVFEPEDLYFSTLWDESSVLVVSEILAVRRQAFRYGMVAMVRKDGNVTGIGDLSGKRLCHPGTDGGPEWNPIISQYFEERVAPSECMDDLPTYEDRIKTTSEFFGSACKAGPWSADQEEDARLKNKYWNLCALCDGGDCGATDKYRGIGGSIICFKDGIGDVLWARHEDVKAHLKFLESGSPDSASEYNYLCEDGTLLPLTSEEPCVWLARPWQVVGANWKSAKDVQKLMDVLSDDVHEEWEENVLHIIELYLEYIKNLWVSRTPEDYLRTIPGYLSASVMSQGNCKPRHSVKMCVTTAVEENKCRWMSKAGSAFGIQPYLECVQLANTTACLDSVAKTQTDAVSIPPDFFYDAAVKFNLESFLLETGHEFAGNYLSTILVKEKSGAKKLSDLKGKRVCLTRLHGIGWWSLKSALHGESLIGAFCEGVDDFFGEVCPVSGGSCCVGGGTEDEEAEVLRCLHEEKCDAAVLNFNTLKDNADGRNPELWAKDLRSSDYRTLCGNPEESEGCHLLWSHTRYLMTSANALSSKRRETFNVFFRLGQRFGRDSRNNNPMLEIFGPFQEVKNVLFKDSSASFVSSSRWNRSYNYLEILNKMKTCSKSSPQLFPSVYAAVLVVFSVFFTTDSTYLYAHLRLR